MEQFEGCNFITVSCYLKKVHVPIMRLKTYEGLDVIKVLLRLSVLNGLYLSTVTGVKATCKDLEYSETTYRGEKNQFTVILKLNFHF